MSGSWSSSEALPLSGAATTGGRRRRSAKVAEGGRRRRTAKAEGGRRRRHAKGGDVAPPPADVKAAAEDLASVSAPQTMEAGQRRHTKAKKVAKALLKLSKKLKASKRSRKH
jgi:hypothetical protein